MRKVAFVAVALAVLAADQVTKMVVSHRIPTGAMVPVLPPILYLTDVTNDGVAWSLFRGHTAIFSVVAVVFCVGVLIAARSALERSRLLAFALALLLGGSVGNLLDRVRFHYVVDFIDLHIGSLYRWPTFNLADSAITVGMVLLAWFFWTADRRSEPTQGESTSVESTKVDPPSEANTQIETDVLARG